jgi:hypothetical protein
MRDQMCCYYLAHRAFLRGFLCENLSHFWCSDSAIFFRECLDLVIFGLGHKKNWGSTQAFLSDFENPICFSSGEFPHQTPKSYFVVGTRASMSD